MIHNNQDQLQNIMGFNIAFFSYTLVSAQNFPHGNPSRANNKKWPNEAHIPFIYIVKNMIPTQHLQKFQVSMKSRQHKGHTPMPQPYSSPNGEEKCACYWWWEGNQWEPMASAKSIWVVKDKETYPNKTHLPSLYIQTQVVIFQKVEIPIQYS